MSDRSHCPHEVGAGRLAADRDRAFRQRTHDHDTRPDRVADVSAQVMLGHARAVLARFNHNDVLGSLADLHDALHPKENQA